MICCYNRMVDCETRKTCASCGWDPRVSAARVARLQERLENEKAARKTVIEPAPDEVWTYRV